MVEYTTLWQDIQVCGSNPRPNKAFILIPGYVSYGCGICQGPILAYVRRIISGKLPEQFKETLNKAFPVPDLRRIRGAVKV